MGERSPRERLEDIVAWGERLARHIAGETFETFMADALRQDAVCRCIEVVGEASRQLMLARPHMEAQYPALELRQAYGARNALAHGYLTVDYRLVWKTATLSIPRIVKEARRILAEEDF